MICSSLEIKHKFCTAAHHCAISSPDSPHGSSFQSSVSSGDLSHLNLSSLHFVHEWKSCRCLHQSLKFSDLSCVICHWAASSKEEWLSPPLLPTAHTATRFCSGFRTAGISVAPGHLNLWSNLYCKVMAKYNTGKLSSQPFYQGTTNMFQIPWMLHKKNLEMSQRMDHRT